jgi:hypothetical protein
MSCEFPPPHPAERPRAGGRAANEAALDELIESGETLPRMTRLGRRWAWTAFSSGTSRGASLEVAEDGKTPWAADGLRYGRVLARPSEQSQGPTPGSCPQGIRCMPADCMSTHCGARGSGFAARARSPALCSIAIRPGRRTSYRQLDANLASGYANLSKIVDGGAAKGKTQ